MLFTLDTIGQHIRKILTDLIYYFLFLLPLLFYLRGDVSYFSISLEYMYICKNSDLLPSTWTSIVIELYAFEIDLHIIPTAVIYPFEFVLLFEIQPQVLVTIKK